MPGKPSLRPTAQARRKALLAICEPHANCSVERKPGWKKATTKRPAALPPTPA